MTAATTAEAVFVDTNVLVYAHDVRDPRKHARAVDLVESLLRADRLIVSAQVLNEFYVSVTRPNRPARIDHAQASQIVRDLASVCEVIPVDAAATMTALDAIHLHGFSFWDGLIWAAARLRGVRMIYTEDFQHGRDVDGVRFVKPVP